MLSHSLVIVILRFSNFDFVIFFLFQAKLRELVINGCRHCCCNKYWWRGQPHQPHEHNEEDEHNEPVEPLITSSAPPTEFSQYSLYV